MWHVTCDTWHVTRDTWHGTRDTWQVGGGEPSLKISAATANLNITLNCKPQHYTTLQTSTLNYTAHLNTTLHWNCTTLHHRLLHCIVLKLNLCSETLAIPWVSTVQLLWYNFEAHWTVLHCTSLHYTVHHWIALYIAALHCTSLHFTEPFCT